MKTRIRTIMTAALILAAASLNLPAQTAPVTYQGRLDEDGIPATGMYDFQFSVVDAVSGGRALFGPHTVTDMLLDYVFYTHNNAFRVLPVEAAVRPYTANPPLIDGGTSIDNLSDHFGLMVEFRVFTP